MLQRDYQSTWIVKRANRTPREHLPLGVMAVGSYLLNRDWKEFWAENWFAQLFWVYQGEGVFQLGDRRIPVQADDLFFYFPHTEHRIESASENWGYCWVDFDHANCVQWLKGFGFHEGRFRSCPCPRDLFSQVGDALQLGSREGECQASIVAHEILVRASQGMESEPDSLMTRAKLRMDEGSSDPNLTVQSLADELEIHRTTLFRMFRRQYGVTPNDYLKRLRLHRALQMVQQGNHSVHEIARICGYSDSNYLTRLVKQHLGRSARDMRKIRQREPANPPR
ncbi:AraC family transcriptional regulator [Kiritimatiellota bacterium B12222]|nr:AraC family transcriptional regulator [Kiritimatiellota bacterium B12222]